MNLSQKLFKSLLNGVTLVIALTSAFLQPFYVLADFDYDTKVTVNGEPTILDKPVFFDDFNKEIYLPLRSFFEKNGYIITYDNKEKIIYGINGSNSFSIKIGSDSFSVNGKIYSDESSPSKIKNSDAYISDFTVSRILNSGAAFNEKENSIDFVKGRDIFQYSYSSSDYISDKDINSYIISEKTPIVDKSTYEIIEREFSNIYMRLEDAYKNGLITRGKDEYAAFSKEVYEYIRDISKDSSKLNTQEKVDAAVKKLTQYIEKLKEFSERNIIDLFGNRSNQ